MCNKYIIYTDIYIFVVFAEDQMTAIELIKKETLLKNLKPKRIEIAAYGFFVNSKIDKIVFPDYIGFDLSNLIISKDNKIFINKKKLSNNYYLGEAKEKLFYSRPFKKVDLLEYFERKNLKKENNSKIIKNNDLYYFRTDNLSLFGEFISGFWNFRQHISELESDDDEESEI